MLGIKTPPFAQSQIDKKAQRFIIRHDQEFVQLEFRVIKEHVAAFQWQGALIQSPSLTGWWVLYDREEIVRYGHRLNINISPSAAEAEFIPEP
jgi:hypothetical protein